jgi:hypothetical protein
MAPPPPPAVVAAAAAAAVYKSLMKNEDLDLDFRLVQWICLGPPDPPGLGFQQL